VSSLYVAVCPGVIIRYGKQTEHDLPKQTFQ